MTFTRSKMCTADTEDCEPGKNSVGLMPQTEGPIICAEFSGLVDAHEHEHCLSDPIREAIRQYGYYRLLLHFTPDFIGWATDAADLNMKVIIECARKCQKAAYVNPPEKKVLQMKLTGDILVGGKIRYFDTEQLDEALEWIKQ